MVAATNAEAVTPAPPAAPVITQILSGGVGDGGPALSALVNASAVVREPAGTYLFADTRSHQIRRYDPVAGTVAAVFGDGQLDSTLDALKRGPIDATTAPLPNFTRLWLTTDGTLFGIDAGDGGLSGGDLFAIDPTSHQIRLVFANQPLAGTSFTPVFVLADGSYLVAVRQSTPTEVDAVWAFAPSAAAGVHTTFLGHFADLFAQAPDGTVYDALTGGGGVSRVGPGGSDTLVAGDAPADTGGSTADGVPALGARILVENLAADSSGRLLFLDSATAPFDRLRVAVIGGNVTSIAHQTAAVDDPVCWSGSLLMTTTVAVLPCTQLRSFALDGSQSGTTGTVMAGLPDGVTESATPATPASTFIGQATALTVDPLTADPVVASADTVVRVHGTGGSGTVTRVAGDPSAAPGSGDGGPAVAAGVSPEDLAYGPDGTLYIEDRSLPSTRIRAVQPNGTITTVGGGGTHSLVDGLSATDAYLDGTKIAADAGHVYVSSGIGSDSYGVFSLDLATHIWHLVAGGGSTEPAEGLAATSVQLTDPPTVAIRTSDGALLVRSQRTLAIAGGLTHLLHGPDNVASSTLELGSDSAGDVYTFANDASAPSTIFESPADGSPELLLLGTIGAATVGHGASLRWMAVSADGTLYAVADDTPTNSLLRVTASPGPWPGAAPTLSITAPLSGAGPFTVTVTPPATGPHWHSVVIATPGTVAAQSLGDGRWVTSADLTTDSPAQTTADGSLGPCPTGGDCFVPFAAGTTYSFSLFSFPDGSPASVMPVSVTSATPVLTGDTFTSVSPQRVLDTRSGLGTERGQPGRVGPGEVIGLVLPVVDPANRPDAFVLNLTVVAPTANTYVTAYPANAASPPTVSNVNVPAHRTVANLVTVKATNGVVWIKNFAGTTDLVADLVGFYAVDAANTYTPLAPARILDTRSGVGAAKAPVGSGRFVDLQVTGRAGIPADARAVVMNLTATGPSAATFVQAYPTPSTPGPAPTVSTINLVPGQTAANLVTVALGAGGRVRLGNHLGSVNLVADVAGYFSADPSGSLFTPVDPVRVLDTRSTPTRVGAGGVRDLALVGQWGIPSGASGIVFNLTAVDPSAATYVQAYPTPVSGSAFPTISNLNLAAGGIVANLVSVAIGSNGQVRLRNAFGSVDLLADIAGYYSRPPG